MLNSHNYGTSRPPARRGINKEKDPQIFAPQKNKTKKKTLPNSANWKFFLLASDQTSAEHIASVSVSLGIPR